MYGREYYWYIWEDYYKAFDSHDVSIVDCCDYEKGVIAKHARVFLRRWPEPERKGVFRFLDLPPELRDRIYHMVFVYLGPTILVESDGWSGATLKAAGHDVRDTSDYNTSGYEHEPRDIGTPDTVLGQMALCKQMKAEAVPLFYCANGFKFRSESAQSTFVRVTDKESLSHLKKIQIVIGVCHYTCIASSYFLTLAIDTLFDVTTLEELFIVIRDSCTDKHCRFSGPRTSLTTNNTTSLGALARLISKTKKVDISFIPFHPIDTESRGHPVLELLIDEAARRTRVQAVEGDVDKELVEESQEVPRDNET